MRIIPYIVLDGNAREAIDFYAEVFGGKIEGIMTYGDSPFPGMPEEANDRVMHAHLTIGDAALMFSDSFPGQSLTFGEQVMVTVMPDSVEEAERIYARLAEGAQKVEMELQKTDWSPAYASLTDKFGIPFQISARAEH